MNRKLNKKKVFIVILCIIIIAFVIISIRRTFSRYQLQQTSQSDVDIAFWLVTDTVQEERIIIEDLVPYIPQEYTFSISNNNGTIRTDTEIEYEIILDVTTNIPLTYKIYEKSGGDKILCTADEEIVTDEDGTYYRIISFGEEFEDDVLKPFELGYTENQTKEYILEIELENRDAIFADLVDSAKLKIVAQQKISE